jgi:hypothetical protein
MKRRGSFTSAGPVRVRRPDPETGEITTYTQPAYSPRGYWQVIKAHERENELRSIAEHIGKGATKRRLAISRKVQRGTDAVQSTQARRRSGD